jgi:hypothetical protein
MMAAALGDDGELARVLDRDVGPAAVFDPAAHLDFPPLEPGQRLGPFRVGAQNLAVDAGREVGAPVAAEIEIGAGFRCLHAHDAAFDDLIAVAIAQELAPIVGFARCVGRVRPQADPRRARHVLVRQELPRAGEAVGQAVGAGVSGAQEAALDPHTSGLWRARK